VPVAWVGWSHPAYSLRPCNVAHTDGQPRFLIKGGAYIELRLGLSARATKVFGCWSNGRVDAVLAAARNLDAIGFFLNSGEQTPSLVSAFIVLACVESAWRHPKRSIPSRRLFKKAYTWLRRRLGRPGGRLHGLWLLAQAEVAALQRGEAPAGAFAGAATALAASGYYALAGEAFERWGRDRLRHGDDVGAAMPLMLANRSLEAWGSPYRARRLQDELLNPLMARLGGLQDVLSGLMSATAATSGHPATQTQTTNRGDLLPRLAPGVTHTLGSGLGLDVKLRAALDELLRLTSGTRAAYVTWDASTGRLAAAGDTATGRALPVEVLSYVTRTRETLLVDDASQPNALALALPRVASLLAIPVHTHGELLGVLYVENTVLADLRPRLERDHIAASVDVDAHVEAVIKPDHITTVLRHLVDNACDAVHAGGASEPSIWIRGILEPQGVVLTVRDNGRGLAAAHREQLFQPFFRTKGGGAGPGALAMHRGRIRRPHRCGVRRRGPGSELHGRHPAPRRGGQGTLRRTVGVSLATWDGIESVPGRRQLAVSSAADLANRWTARKPCAAKPSRVCSRSSGGSCSPTT
jgi:signal transduction histidine kinase